MRHDILQRLHDGHQGIVKCRERARGSVRWSRISRDIQNTVSACKHCQESKPTQKREPLITTPLPSRPWEKVAAGRCEVNQQSDLVVADYFSRYMEIAYLRDMSGETASAKLKNTIARWGCPNELITDNRPQFSGRAFIEFAQEYDFKHYAKLMVRLSEPYRQPNES